MRAGYAAAARCIFAVLRRCLEVRNSRVAGVVACDPRIRHRWPRHPSTKVRGDPAWLLAVSLVVPAGLLFLVSGQPRLLPPILVGAGIAAGLCAKLVASIGPQVRAAALLLALAIAATLLVPADRATAQYADFYRVVDESLMRAATAIESDAALEQSPLERIVAAGRSAGGSRHCWTDPSSSAPIRDGWRFLPNGNTRGRQRRCSTVGSTQERFANERPCPGFAIWSSRNGTGSGGSAGSPLPDFR